MDPSTEIHLYYIQMYIDQSIKIHSVDQSTEIYNGFPTIITIILGELIL